MNKFESITKSLMWLMALLLVSLTTGCGGGGGDGAALGGGGGTAKAITAYSLAGVTGAINETAKTIAVTMPSGTNVTALAATFTTTGASVKVGTTAQASGTTLNNFATPVAYIITAADGSTVSYTVTVTLAPSSARAITAYSLAGVAGTINEAAKTIMVAMPSGTNVTALVATFTTTGAGIKISATVQTSGVTVNNFTSPVIYIVTATDNSTATYTVTVAPVQGTASVNTQGTAPANGGNTSNTSNTPPVAVALVRGPAPVLLGSAGSFVILAKTGVSTTGSTAVVGDIGVSPAAASYITGFSLVADSTNVFSTSSLVTGKLYAANYAVPTPANMTTAVSDMETAFTDAAGRATPDFTELYAGDISGRTLVPGLYKWGTGVLITGVGVTLAGGQNDVWIFQIAQNLTVSNSAMITLSGGAQAKNIFWQVSGQATLGTAADFKGIILCQTLISLNTVAVMNGRALAQTAVTLNANAVTKPD